MTLFANYNDQFDPQVFDSDGNVVSRSAFDVTRTYINVTGNLSRLFAFRITPDVARESSTSPLSGSLEFRIKYAYVQANFDDWMTAGSYARFGIQQTPYLDYSESIYRYRFQGTMFAERNGYFSSADAGVSFRWNIPGNYGDVHVGVFNGENYNKAEVNDQKAVMIRATVRPFATRVPALRGLRATVFHDGDHYVMDAERRRTLGQLTFEHPRAVVGFEYLSARDRLTGLRPAGNSSGYSVWLTPRSTIGWEGLFRYDRLTPNTIAALELQKQNRTIVGIAYWFPHVGSGSAAFMLDYDAEHFENIRGTPARTLAIHALLSF